MAAFQGDLKVETFKVSVSDEALDDLKQGLRIAKIGPTTGENTTRNDSTYGVSREWVVQARDYWLSKYDWRKTEARINSFDNFQVPVKGEDGELYKIHFLAVQSKKKDAIPLALLHGWPGSILEFLSLLELVQAKYKPEELPYTIIVPSLPGYGFSEGPSLEKQWTCESISFVVDQLMVGLGFGSGYISQGGDLGSFVARILAARHESCKATHLNFEVIPPPEGVGQDKVESNEAKGLERANEWATQGNGYAMLHGQRPATIGLLLSTSPLALLIWIGEKYLDWVDKPLSMDTILDSVAFYWLTETFPRSIYPYRQFFGPSPESIPLKHYVDKPMGFSWFPREIYPMPKAWVSTTGNLVWFKHHTAGGHFAALEVPQDLLDDIEEFVSKVWKA